VDYERFFPASPARVLGALLGALSARGQVLGIGDFGTAVTFIPSHSVLGEGRLLVARAQDWQGGTLVQVSEAEHGTPWDDDAEFMDLLTVLGEVARTLGPDSTERCAAAHPLPRHVLPEQRDPAPARPGLVRADH
jgi:hypothetical protein